LVDVLKKDAEDLNRRFITFHTLRRPYIILKWAQTADGFIAPDQKSMTAEQFQKEKQITGSVEQKLVHRWRSEEDAILVGTRTAEVDDPRLSVRAWKGKDPLRLVIDRDLRLPRSLHLFQGDRPAILFAGISTKSSNENVEHIDFTGNVPEQIAQYLYSRQVQSLIVEGGTFTLDRFIACGLWDEARVFTGPRLMHEGVRAPVISATPIYRERIGQSDLQIFRHT
jgi:diaminohydroxyphosphoribosylaminopyrimidine deaminase / 5-amino-6-(5-phosphoribosylamino)uracil reductase